MGALNTRVRGLLEVLAAHEPRLGGSASAAMRTIRYGFAPNWTGEPFSVAGGIVAALGRVAHQGIAVAWVPRPEVLADLMRSDPSDLRTRVLAHEAEILDDCCSAAAESQPGPLAELASRVSEACAAARDGHHSAAQALASNILDTTLREACPFGEWQAYRAVREAIEDLRRREEWIHLRRGLAFAPLLLAVGTYQRRSDPVPAHYNRHATAHAVGATQYTRSNAVIAIMAVASALRQCHEDRRPSPAYQ
ncbi:hypothetical protein ACFY36_07655 [Actinoplanes sp. NPDC000266]